MKKGFTLIELLVVVLIIGILAAIALPQYTKAVEKSRLVEAAIILKNLKDSFDRQVLAEGSFPATAPVITDLDIDVPGTYSSTDNSISGKNFMYGITCSGTVCMVAATKSTTDVSKRYLIGFDISSDGSFTRFCGQCPENTSTTCKIAKDVGFDTVKNITACRAGRP
ncbi:prepilin-type N-terminal cleavage/methylation domain-containing protein [Elusimicrobium simillimum]|uniref:type IV pilin protein n=1 Tax=Elusimicrobium simillimum TaxID=3143438 RepID=UPI003C6F15ED